jgi:hypothetical protein
LVHFKAADASVVSSAEANVDLGVEIRGRSRNLSLRLKNTELENNIRALSAEPKGKSVKGTVLELLVKQRLP